MFHLYLSLQGLTFYLSTLSDLLYNIQLRTDALLRSQRIELGYSKGGSVNSMVVSLTTNHFSSFIFLSLCTMGFAFGSSMVKRWHKKFGCILGIPVAYLAKHLSSFSTLKLSLFALVQTGLHLFLKSFHLVCPFLGLPQIASVINLCW